MAKPLKTIFSGISSSVRKIFLISLAAACCFGMARCISFNINVLVSPENVISEVAICEGIDDSGELLKPLEITSEFDSGAENIICFIGLVNVTQQIRLKWKWYMSEHELYRESPEVTVNEDEEYLEHITAYDKITYDSIKDMPGEWLVVVLMNNELIARRFFLVKSPIDKINR